MQNKTISLAKLERKVIPIVPYSVKGTYRNTKTLILLLAYVVFFSLPWLKWQGANRVGQALLFDIANAKFYFFDLVIYPHDLMLLVAMMIFAAVVLFVSATYYGRIFCGFFCFQTIWTDAFRMIERAIQGEAQARIKMRQQPWSLEKAYKLAATYFLWFMLSLATAVTFTLYFAEAGSLLVQVMDGSAPKAAYVAISTLTATTFIAAGIAKEDICRVACPYGKFQSVMQDAATRTVVYDAARGERAFGRAVPTRALKDASLRQEQGLGDCIDCGYCVNVCPTGVDIRKGFQIDCISCGLCIDACNHIMQAVKLPTGLIRFDSLQQGDKLVMQDKRWPMFKKLGYWSMLLITGGMFVHQLNNLQPFSASIQQQAQPLVTRMSNGDLKSRYTIKLTNKTSVAEAYDIQFDGVPSHAVQQAVKFNVPAGKTYTYTVDLVVPEQTAKRLKAFTLKVSPLSAPESRRHFPMTYINKAV